MPPPEPLINPYPESLCSKVTKARQLFEALKGDIGKSVLMCFEADSNRCDVLCKTIERDILGRYEQQDESIIQIQDQLKALDDRYDIPYLRDYVTNLSNDEEINKILQSALELDKESEEFCAKH